MVKDGEDWHGLLTTNFKNIGKSWRSAFKDTLSVKEVETETDDYKTPHGEEKS